MDYLGQNGALGLTTEQTEKVLQFQDLTGIEDMTVCRDVLQRHQWNLEVAVQEQLNIREGRPSVYATETRPPAVVSDHLAVQHVYYAPPTDGSAGGVGGLVRAVVGLLWNMCYSTIMTLLQITRRMLGLEYRPRTDPVEEVMDFIRTYEDRYTSVHPVFYRGTFSQALNDAKRELRFLLVYLHDDASRDTEQFCRNSLAHADVVDYVNANFLFWACGADSEEGRRTLNAVKSSGATFPLLSVLVLKEGRMTIVGRQEGFCEASLTVQRLANVVAEFDVCLAQARADRVEQSINRSLRAHQDEAFQESLRADQEKERKREELRRREEDERRRAEEEEQAEHQRRLSIRKEKIESITRVPDEPDSTNPDAVHVVFKLPCGSRLDRRFLKSHSLEHVFYFVFSHPKAPDSFEITTNFPKRVLPCNPEGASNFMTLEEAGLKNREVLFVHDLDA
ncbi:unnamed protein product [Brassicogethes aeneus]|uniref:UAS domain-containing protein n=1 Tax=Brassicogethes aeneus TaxID=1431903 RepID=A0A9P0BIZ4_BRAAE|nr:unnamed protein product [Brassicogethes aeneus]